MVDAATPVSLFQLHPGDLLGRLDVASAAAMALFALGLLLEAGISRSRSACTAGLAIALLVVIDTGGLHRAMAHLFIETLAIGGPASWLVIKATKLAILGALVTVIGAVVCLGTPGPGTNAARLWLTAMLVTGVAGELGGAVLEGAGFLLACVEEAAECLVSLVAASALLRQLATFQRTGHLHEVVNALAEETLAGVPMMAL